MRDREAGFTLIEMMVTVAVIAILAAIALPSFFGEARKNKAFSEVQPMFNDLRVRLEEYLQEHGTYPPTLDETTLHPSLALGTTRNPINPMPPAWTDIKVRISGPDQVYCGYTWVTGLADVGAGTPPVGYGSIGPEATLFGFTRPVTDWYYLLAKCNMDGDAAKFSYYFSSSVTPEIKKLDEGS
jgi:prepilin-type N-terminal cleavage/methylation domain-containing protein